MLITHQIDIVEYRIRKIEVFVLAFAHFINIADKAIEKDFFNKLGILSRSVYTDDKGALTTDICDIVAELFKSGFYSIQMVKVLADCDYLFVDLYKKKPRCGEIYVSSFHKTEDDRGEYPKYWAHSFLDLLLQCGISCETKTDARLASVIYARSLPLVRMLYTKSE